MTIIAPGAVLPSTAPSFLPRGSAAADSGFRIPSPPEAPNQPAVGQAGAAPSTIATSAMLALQEQTGTGAYSGQDAMDREARRHGQQILEALAALQRTLLTSAGSAEGLARLAALAEVDPAVHDPALARILSSIRLRARLEILRRAPPRQDLEPASAAADNTVSVTSS